MEYVIKTNNDEKLQKACITYLPWGGTAPECYGSIYVKENSLCVNLTVNEANPRCEINEMNGNVYTDSCIEFFISPNASEAYFNFEFNCKGILLLGYRLNHSKRFRVDIDDFREFFNIKNVVEQEQWTISFEIPLSFINSYFPDVNFSSGTVMSGNFYKCGDLTPNPHFAAWSPVMAETPNFHLPNYFGKLIIS